MPKEELYCLKVSKNIAGEDLLALGEDLQVILVNIEWGKKGQTMREFKELKFYYGKKSDQAAKPFA